MSGVGENERITAIEADIRDLQNMSMKHEEDIKHNQKTHEKFFSRLETIERGNVGYQKDLEYLIGTVNELKTTVTANNAAMKECMDEIKNQVLEINMKPAKKWENITWQVVMSVVSAIIGGVIVFLSGGKG